MTVIGSGRVNSLTRSMGSPAGKRSSWSRRRSAIAWTRGRMAAIRAVLNAPPTRRRWRA